MRRQELEMLVLSAVSSILSGKRVEDSRIECKAEWPDPKKARQLAAHANSARGEEIIWIIGVDEKAGRITGTATPDLAKWWDQMSAQFDDRVYPELTDLVVPIEDGKAVTALAFSTDRAPYVVSVSPGGNSEREVPIRDGTRTRSARRHELLQIMQPVTVTPNASLTYARLEAVYISELSGHPISEPETTQISMECHVFFEVDPERIVFIPYHLMTWSVTTDVDQELLNFGSSRLAYLPNPVHDAPTPRYGAIFRPDGVMVAGPAIAAVRGDRSVSGDSRESFKGVSALNLNVRLGVAGAVRPITLSVSMRRVSLLGPNNDSSLFGRWELDS